MRTEATATAHAPAEAQPARHTLITLNIAIGLALEAWDSTVLPAARDGALQEAMERLRDAQNAFSLTIDYAIQTKALRGVAWVTTDGGKHCTCSGTNNCDHFDTLQQAEEFAARLRQLYPDMTFHVRAVPKLQGGPHHGL